MQAWQKTVLCLSVSVSLGDITLILVWSSCFYADFTEMPYAAKYI